MTEKEQIAQLERRLKGIADLLNLDPRIPDRWVGHIEAQIREWSDDREKAWAENKKLIWEKANRVVATLTGPNAALNLDRLIDSFMVEGFPLNPNDLYVALRNHFSPLWSKILRLEAENKELQATVSRLNEDRVYQGRPDQAGAMLAE